MAPPTTSVIKQAREKQSAVFADLETLSKKYGADLFRILGQRYFKQEREESALRKEIAEREAELRKLQEKAQPRSGKMRIG